MIITIAAISSNGVIGIDNKLPWHLPADILRFKQLTTNNTVVMGRKTFESIGRPLPRRKNIILSRNSEWEHTGVTKIGNLSEIDKSDDEKIFIIGGSQIYNEYINISDVLEITLIDKEFEGDSFFPKIDKNIWIESKRESFKNDEFEYHYITYTKR